MIILAAPGGCSVLPARLSRKIRDNLPPYFGFMGPLAAPAEGDVIDVLAIADPATPWPRHMKKSRTPTVALLGDDPGCEGGYGGPDAWACANKLGRWARAVLVHGAGGEAQHYAEATRAALKVGRVALIETTSANARAWALRLNCPRTLMILPRDGLHPISLEEMAL